MTEERERPSLLAALDMLADAEHLVEAVFMAVSSLPLHEANALHAVTIVAKQRITDAKDQLYAIKDGEKGGSDD